MAMERFGMTLTQKEIDGFFRRYDHLMLLLKQMQWLRLREKLPLQQHMDIEEVFTGLDA